MTAPMPETMSPREKVARLIDNAPEHQTADELADDILASLASSGDHAELARLAEEVRAPMSTKTMGMHLDATEKFQRAAKPATVLALIAEVAALRASASVIEPELGDLEATNADLSARLTEAERELSEHRITADLLVSTLKADKEEAERKLAEAVGLLGEALNEMDRRVITAETANRIDYFLSKEAERG